MLSLVAHLSGVTVSRDLAAAPLRYPASPGSISPATHWSQSHDLLLTPLTGVMSAQSQGLLRIPLTGSHQQHVGVTTCGDASQNRLKNVQWLEEHWQNMSNPDQKTWL